MAQLTASRTLVKSTPELWAECSDAASLARHLGAFGEIHITKLEPETAVAWEGEAVCGTVTLEPSGWGTRVVLTAELPTPAVGVGEPAAEVPAAPERESIAVPDPVVAVVEPAPSTEPGSVVTPESAPSGFFRRLFGARRRRAALISTPDPDRAADDDTSPTPAPAPEVHAAPMTAEPISSSEPAAAAERPAPAAPADPVSATEPDSVSAQALVGALDSLGRAHRRPFSHG